MNAPPFEIHITTTELDEHLLAEFVDFCATIAAKPIVIELPEGRQRQQPMISKVVRLDNPQEIHGLLAELESAFVAAGFPAERIKVEVPVEHEIIARATFPDFRGGYFEWHGKVAVEDVDDLKRYLIHPAAHLSRNALKGQAGTRFITLRDTSSAFYFLQSVRNLSSVLERNGYPLIKAEAEYCCFDSNKRPDQGWSDVPEITDEGYLEFLAHEGFLRRMAEVDAPFMLKGSLVMRQYLTDPTVRHPADVDLVCLEDFADSITAEPVFTSYTTQVTETYVDDGMTFRSFTENTFWRRIDYAMNDDFPTVNTDLLVTFANGQNIEISLDVSWNLPVPTAPIPLHYKPLNGTPFTLRLTVPVELQISWKLHQTVVNTRTKDLMDLVLLLSQRQPSSKILSGAITAFREECKKDNISPTSLLRFLNGESAGELREEERSALERWEEQKRVNPKIAPLKYFVWEKHSFDLPRLQRGWETPSDVYLDFVRVCASTGLTELFTSRLRL